MTAYLDFVIACGILGCFFAGMAFGMWITERQYTRKRGKHERN